MKMDNPGKKITAIGIGAMTVMGCASDQKVPVPAYGDQSKAKVIEHIPDPDIESAAQKMARHGLEFSKGVEAQGRSENKLIGAETKHGSKKSPALTKIKAEGAKGFKDILPTSKESKAKPEQRRKKSKFVGVEPPLRVGGNINLNEASDPVNPFAKSTMKGLSLRFPLENDNVDAFFFPARVSPPFNKMNFGPRWIDGSTGIIPDGSDIDSGNNPTKAPSTGRKIDLRNNKRPLGPDGIKGAPGLGPAGAAGISIDLESDSSTPLPAGDRLDREIKELLRETKSLLGETRIDESSRIERNGVQEATIDEMKKANKQGSKEKEAPDRKPGESQSSAPFQTIRSPEGLLYKIALKPQELAARKKKVESFIQDIKNDRIPDLDKLSSKLKGFTKEETTAILVAIKDERQKAFDNKDVKAQKALVPLLNKMSKIDYELALAASPKDSSTISPNKAAATKKNNEKEQREKQPASLLNKLQVLISDKSKLASLDSINKLIKKAKDKGYQLTKDDKDKILLMLERVEGKDIKRVKHFIKLYNQYLNQLSKEDLLEEQKEPRRSNNKLSHG